jgi:hypothetical protein
VVNESSVQPDAHVAGRPLSLIVRSPWLGVLVIERVMSPVRPLLIPLATSA